MVVTLSGVISLYVDVIVSVRLDGRILVKSHDEELSYRVVHVSFSAAAIRM